MKKTKSPTIRRAAAAAVGAGALLLAAGGAQAALQDRDLDGNGQVDAFYDTDLNITWLRDANVNGPTNWYDAVAWAAGFSFGGYDDWRLPTTLQPDPTCEFQYGGASYGYNCTGSEMGHLWYVELGNTAGSLTNSGNFQNFQTYAYWSGTESALIPPGTMAYVFFTFDGTQGGGTYDFPYVYALAVRPGDVAAIPEPQAYALMLAGLTGLAVARRRRPR